MANVTEVKDRDMGTNVRGAVKGTQLILVIDLTKDYGPSKSGKTLTVASTGGFVRLPGMENFMFNLSVNKR